MKGIAGHLPGGLPMPLPAPYLVGFDGVRLDAESGEFPNYLFGRWSRQGTPLYYLVCFLFKTPLPFLIACLLAPFVRLRSPARGEIYAALPLAILLVSYSALTGNVNYGIRHILSAFPLLFIYASRLTPFFLERTRLSAGPPWPGLLALPPLGRDRDAEHHRLLQSPRPRPGGRDPPRLQPRLGAGAEAPPQVHGPRGDRPHRPRLLRPRRSHPLRDRRLLPASGSSPGWSPSAPTSSMATAT